MTRQEKAAARALRKKNRIRDGQTAVAWLYAAPALLVISVFIIIPFIMSTAYSFTDKMLVARAGRPVSFVGLANYVKMFESAAVRQAFGNTFMYALLVVPALIVLATLLALLVNRKIRGVSVFRTIYFSPQVVTMTVVAVIWSFIFSPSSDGFMNSLLGLFGIPPQTWLKDPNLALGSIAVMYIWQALGLQMVIVLGGLQYIPEELYEAGYMDGCNVLQKFWHITIPMLKNTLVYVLVSNTIYALRLFTQVFVLTNGGPKGSTNTVVYTLYTAGFTNSQVGYSSAISVVFFLIVLAISLLQNRFLGKEE
ncbi:carbohydrate ABC transporter permease [Breznakiella homolactica]|uniref:Sugar ABC transporter permease n=1 Tax=Breznakiella homolactica TaxID=2798577 RepID=A0A7T8B7H2_9SPIR|nr:sugar ABC transporter permease [Breznakiella homolactica]QQO07519.1 sugar ABC transporter permease [Breznakiella homolactica]